jgi:hypothetical protein
MANVVIDIAAEFTGNKAFKQAETSTEKLTKNVKRLAAGVVLAFGTKQIVAFGKASVKAFAEDEKAAASLGQTLKNLNLAYGSNIGTVNGYISSLEIQTGVLDDELRPAMDRLLRATGSVTKAQELLGLALDIAAGTGKSVTQVSQSLQKAYLGQTQALGRLGVGLSKAELESSSFATIQERLNVLFAGQAATAADTYAGSLARLTIAGNNAKETIGKGLVDAFVTITNSSSVDDLITKIDAAAESIANFVRETGEFIKITKSIFDFKNLSLTFKDPNAFQGMGNVSISKSSQDTQRADAIAKKNAMAITKLTKEQAAAQAKILKDKKLQAALDKANLALNKGDKVFDLDKIQIAAALTSQAEQLGKATSSAQMLQIANDTARLNVKQSILNLEEAIASKDQAAIEAATKKLNADLAVLNALTGQNTQMAAIESILKGLTPKDLIDQKNLDEALRKIQEMLKLLAGFKWPSGGPLGGPLGDPFDDNKGKKTLTQARSTDEINKANEELGGVISVIGDNGREFIKLIDGMAQVYQTIDDVGSLNALTNLYAGGAINPFNAGSFREMEGGSLFNSGAVGSRDRDINITIQANTIANPDELTNLIQNSLISLNRRGDSLTQAGAL